MRALLSRSPGGPETLVIGQVEAPSLESGQVLLSVEACGVNFPDTLIIEDRYQYKPQRPFSPGAEVAGVVIDVAADVTSPRTGDRVLAMCGWGGMAEQVVVDASRCIAMPDDMPFEDGGAFIMTFGTAYHALVQRANLKAGEKVLVLGAGGGVGLAVVALARALGAEVTAAASSQQKLDVALGEGATSGLVYPRDIESQAASRALATQFKDASGGNGFDVVVDTVGGDLAEVAIRALAWNGRFLTIGFPAGIPRIPLNLLLLKGASAVGVFYGSFVDREPETSRQNDIHLLDLYRSGAIKPLISARYSLADGGKAIADLAAGQTHGKLVVLPGQA